MSRSKKKRSEQFLVVHPDAAGIDIGAEFHVVAIPPDRGPETVRSFPSFTQDLLALADWLREHRIRTVALESTGVYWIPVFEILEARGFDVILTNARDARNVPGRKSDVNDAQWLQKLHQFGLLRASFQPSAEIAVLRTYLRQRERLLDYCSAHIQHMQKALMQMNVQLHHVVTDITGVTGMRIIRAIIAGEQDPLVLANHRDPRCKASVERITQALTGHYRPEHLFSLTQAVELYDFYQRQVQQCDQRIEAALTALEVPEQVPQAPLPKARHRTKAPNAPAFDVRTALYRALGLDLTQIHGLGPYVSLKLIAECGTDMTRWPTAKHFSSWLCLSPGTKISGGRVLASRTRRSSSRAAAVLRLAATTLSRTDTALGAFYRRLASRVGKAKAVTATARKIATLFYNALRHGMDYVDPGADYYEQHYRERVVHNLRRRAQALGLELREPAPPLEGVS
jgi:transposase